MDVAFLSERREFEWRGPRQQVLGLLPGVTVKRHRHSSGYVRCHSTRHVSSTDEKQSVFYSHRRISSFDHWATAATWHR